MIHSELLKALTLLGREYPTFVVDDARVQTWAALLSDIPPKEILRAAIEHIRESKWPPKPAEIRERAVRADQATLSPEEAWAEVIREVRRVGWIGKPTFSTPAIKRAADSIGSWRTICSQTTEQLAANRAHFYRSYEAFSRRETREAEQIAIAPIMDMLLGSGATLLQAPDRLNDEDPDPPARDPEDALDDIREED